MICAHLEYLEGKDGYGMHCTAPPGKPWPMSQKEIKSRCESGACFNRKPMVTPQHKEGIRDEGN